VTATDGSRRDPDRSPQKPDRAEAIEPNSSSAWVSRSRVGRTRRIELLAGVAVLLFYMVGAAVMTLDLRFEPLGALVKTGPAIVLMSVALMTLEAR
jgi:hypothetical protein